MFLQVFVQHTEFVKFYRNASNFYQVNFTVVGGQHTEHFSRAILEGDMKGLLY